MSANEDLILKGQMLAEFETAKNTLKERRSQAARFSECLLKLGKLLQDETLSDVGLDNLISDLPTQQTMKELATAVREAQERIRTIQNSLREKGIEIK